jgi:hypothetical protein
MPHARLFGGLATVCLAQHNDVINALAADRADQPLRSIADQ